jgi:hypothetical protein
VARLPDERAVAGRWTSATRRWCVWRRGAKAVAFALAQDPANWGVAAPTCAVSCKNGGVCVRTNTCDCTGTSWDGATCDSAPLSCGDGTLCKRRQEECDGGACCTMFCKFERWAPSAVRPTAPAMSPRCARATGRLRGRRVCGDRISVSREERRVRRRGDVQRNEWRVPGRRVFGEQRGLPRCGEPVRQGRVLHRHERPVPGRHEGACDASVPSQRRRLRCAELCDGVRDACPTDVKQPTTLACRASAGPCDVVEYCTGTEHVPANVFHNSTVVCRNATGVCDLEARCVGTSAACPAVTYKPATEVCRAANSNVVCDAAELCSGRNVDCPPDGALPIGTSCVLPSPDMCVSNSTCAGLGQCVGVRDQCECASDAECRDGNPCTTDTCVTLVAPLMGRKCVYTPAQDAQVCRPSAGICDEPEVCDGARTTCPADRFNTGSVLCRNATGICDVAENCDGTGATCPRDRFAGNETICRPSTAPCDAPDRCDGGSALCGPNLNQTFGVVCRAAAMACDAAEVCDGLSSACPADRPVVDGTNCTDSDPCTLETVCRMGACEGRRSLCNCQTDADCDDRNDCTEDECIELECKYKFAEALTPCNDQDACTIVDKCNEGGRCQGRSFCENGSKCVKPGPFCECTAGLHWTAMRASAVRTAVPERWCVQ